SVVRVTDLLSREGGCDAAPDGDPRAPARAAGGADAEHADPAVRAAGRGGNGTADPARGGLRRAAGTSTGPASGPDARRGSRPRADHVVGAGAPRGHRRADPAAAADRRGPPAPGR